MILPWARCSRVRHPREGGDSALDGFAQAHARAGSRLREGDEFEAAPLGPEDMFDCGRSVLTPVLPGNETIDHVSEKALLL